MELMKRPTYRATILGIKATRLYVQLDDPPAEDRERLSVPLLLGLAYAASVGGVGTPIGTPPNLIFMQIYEDYTGQAVSFTRWMSWGVPVVAAPQQSTQSSDK